MAKKVTRVAKLQFNATQAKPGPELAGLGIDMGGFTKQFNDATKERNGEVVPVIITAYDDRSFDFELKTTPAAFLLKKAANIKSGASDQTEPVATLTVDQVKKIAEYKIVDLNTDDIEQAIKIIEGTARNMGIMIEGMTPKKVKKIVKVEAEVQQNIVTEESSEPDKEGEK